MQNTNKKDSNYFYNYDYFHREDNQHSTSISSIFNTKKFISNNTIKSIVKNLPKSPLKFNKINNMKSMFSGCESLISLPDISKWNTGNVKSMENMFSGCKSLISLPDLSKWNT